MLALIKNNYKKLNKYNKINKKKDNRKNIFLEFICQHYQLTSYIDENKF